MKIKKHIFMFRKLDWELIFKRTKLLKRFMTLPFTLTRSIKI